jgi:ABC-type sugar transport system permease subunit
MPEGLRVMTKLAFGRAHPDRARHREERAAYLFLSPWLLGLLAFWIVPIVASLVLSFTRWNLFTPPEWVGLSNYRDMRSDADFANSIHVTLKYIVLSVPIYMIAGLGLSLLLNLKMRGINVFRTVLFIPSILSGVAVAILWVSLLNPAWAVPSVVLMGLWGVGGGAIIYLAGLQNIGPQLYEAAALDGAGPWERFRYVTLPMLTPTLLFVLLTSLIGAFQVFDVAYVLTGSQGGAGSGTALNFYLLNLWTEAFSNTRFGFASALAWLMVIFAAVVILAIFKTAGRWVYYEYDPEQGR